jgi:uncharacterized protein (DUF488 family)
MSVTGSSADRLATIGVYGFAAEGFMEALSEAGVVLLLDVRQRRGVRGTQYAWANSLRLQEALRAAGIGYRHLRELAPTTELRHLQYAEDARVGVGKRNRTALADEYVHRYETEILDRVDLGAIAASLPADGRSALLCVERDPEACHRSLVAARLVGLLGGRVLDLRPQQAPD